MSSDIPVLIVGSGAAGSMMGLELGRFGIPVRIVDRLPAPSAYSRAVTVHARTLEMLERIDPLLVKQFLDRGTHSPGYVMHFIDDNGEKSEVRPGLDFTGLDSRYPFLLLHRQDETEQYIRNYMQETFNVIPQWGVTCKSVKSTDNGVQAVLTSQDGSEEIVNCRYLVACDGANSAIRRLLEDSDEEDDYAGAVLQNLDVFINDFPDDDQWVHYCMGPGYFIMVVRLPGGFFRLLMSQPADKANPDEVPHDVFLSILSRHFAGISFGETVWHSRWQSRMRLAHKYRYQNIFLAGDAAHVHSTAGGQGMNCCMQDAYNLAWKLAMVITEKARPELLDSYESERKPIGKQVINAANAIHELFMAGRSHGKEKLLQMQSSGSLDDLLGQVSGLDYYYGEKNAEECKSSLPVAGERMPDVKLNSAQEGEEAKWLYDFTRHTKFTLIVALNTEVLNQQDSNALIELKSLEESLSSVLKIKYLSPAPASLLEHGHQAWLFLIRPDGYIAASCSTSQVELIKEYFKQIY